MPRSRPVGPASTGAHRRTRAAGPAVAAEPQPPAPVYEEAAPTPAVHHHAVRHSSPSFNERIEAVQRALADRHYYWGAIDGIDGPKTIQAVSDFQRDLGVTVTGVADAKTLAALDVK